MKVALVNRAGLTKEVPVGFSITGLLFGFFVPLFRGDFLLSLYLFLLEMAVGGVGVYILKSNSWIMTIILNIIVGLLLNKVYIKRLMSKGYEASTAEGKSILSEKGIA